MPSTSEERVAHDVAAVAAWNLAALTDRTHGAFNRYATRSYAQLGIAMT